MGNPSEQFDNKPLRALDFDYLLPPECVAQAPASPRDQSRLMVVDRSDLSTRRHRLFCELPDLLQSGDLLVLNDTRVVPSRFFCRRATGGKLEGLFLRERALGVWEAMLKNADRCKVGEVIELTDPAGGTAARARLEEKLGAGMWVLDVEPAQSAHALLDAIGLTPLPPYIRRQGRSGEERDRQSYQTMYARTAGAVAAPTAGLHFTPAVMAALDSRGIARTHVTLHVGMGTFLPMKAEMVSEHVMHKEWYEVSSEAAGAIAAARSENRRIVAVGTTSVRVLETMGRGGAARPCQGWTDIFIYPPARFALVDALLTNFHLPQSTLIMLVAAFCSPGDRRGIAAVLAAYAEAVAMQYRFYSFGDAMLIV